MDKLDTYRGSRDVHYSWSKLHSNLGELSNLGPEIWSRFDEIVCINLKTREDRYQSSKSLFDSLGMPVKFHRVDRHPNGGVQGCYESHIQVITSAYERGLNNLLVLEDDIVPGKGLNAKKILESSNLTKVPGVNLVYLGWHPKVTENRTSHFIGSMYRIKAHGSHAYVINRVLMAVLANRPFDGTPIDVLLARFPSSFGVYPTAFVQGMGDSDITSNFSNSKMMKPIRAGIEAWSVNVNIPPQFVLYSIILAIILFVIYVIVSRRLGWKNTKGMYVIIFFLAVIISLLLVMSSGFKRRT